MILHLIKTNSSFYNRIIILRRWKNGAKVQICKGCENDGGAREQELHCPFFATSLDSMPISTGRMFFLDFQYVWSSLHSTWLLSEETPFSSCTALKKLLTPFTFHILRLKGMKNINNNIQNSICSTWEMQKRTALKSYHVTQKWKTCLYSLLSWQRCCLR